jgi:hypothetical protein
MLMRAPRSAAGTARGRRIGRAFFGAASLAVLILTGAAWCSGNAHAGPLHCQEGFCGDHPAIDVWPSLHVLIPTGSN